MLQFYISPHNTNNYKYNLRYATPNLKNIEFAPLKNKEILRDQLRQKNYCPVSKVEGRETSP